VKYPSACVARRTSCGSYTAKNPKLVDAVIEVAAPVISVRYKSCHDGASLVQAPYAPETLPLRDLADSYVVESKARMLFYSDTAGTSSASANWRARWIAF
jgi:hypothetical protein